VGLLQLKPKFGKERRAYILLLYRTALPRWHGHSRPAIRKEEKEKPRVVKITAAVRQCVGGDDRSSCRRPSATTNTSEKRNNPAMETGKSPRGVSAVRLYSRYNMTPPLLYYLSPGCPIPWNASLYYSTSAPHYRRVAMFHPDILGEAIIYCVCIDAGRIGRQRKGDG
jgi:hypothetical protein